MDEYDLDEILQRLQYPITKTARFLKEESARFDRRRIEYKGLNNLVSYADKEAEKILTDACHEILPGAGFITEEETVKNSSAKNGLVWIIDPLDGTTNFIHRLPEFSISLALVEDGVPLIGMVVHVPNGKIYQARKGGGAWCNENRIFVSRETQLAGSLLATGFPYYQFDRMPDYLAILDYFMQHTHGLRRLGSAAIDLAYVAEGVFDGFFEFNLNPWDVAAGICLVKEAGGFVSDFQGGDDALFGREIIAAGNSFPQMLEAIRSRWVRG